MRIASHTGLRRGENGYRTRFLANRFHVSTARIALLAVPEGLVMQRINRWEAGLSELIEAYVEMKRRDTTASQGQNGDFAEFCPENPVERIRSLAAPLPI